MNAAISRFDVVVVGGGAAGLSGALALSRARRSVLVVDAGEPRNAPASGIHGYLGRENTPPAELTAIGRHEVESYGGTFMAGRVSSAEMVEGGGFLVNLGDGSQVHARRLLVATGLVDELPDIDGLAERWGRDVLHCPYCHGWEVRDRPIAVLAVGLSSVDQALLWRQWSNDITLFSHEEPAWDDDAIERLEARGIRVVSGRVAALMCDNDELVGLRLADGQDHPCAALVVAPRFVASSDVLASLGARTTELEVAGRVAGTYVASDATGLTEIAGVWVAGNITDLFGQVIGAAAGAGRSAAAINADLVAEDVRIAVAAGRQPFSARSERELSERVLGDRRHGLDAQTPGTPT